jgi:hypothetical protein
MLIHLDEYRRDLVRRRTAMASGARWTGESGAVHHASVHPLGVPLPDIAGAFILARPDRREPQNWVALYVATAASVGKKIRTRLDTDTLWYHAVWNSAVALGLTAVHIVASADAAERQDIADDLVRSLFPSLNREIAALRRRGVAGGRHGVTV